MLAYSVGVLRAIFCVKPVDFFFGGGLFMISNLSRSSNAEKTAEKGGGTRKKNPSKSGLVSFSSVLVLVLFRKTYSSKGTRSFSFANSDSSSFPSLPRYIRQNPSATSWLLESNFHREEEGGRAGEFLAQALSYLFLIRFGGTVLDFDTILSKSVTTLGQFIAR